MIFAFWRADLCLVGAYLFGALSALPFALQARDVTVTPEFLQALPYVMTIVVLVIVSTTFAKSPVRGARRPRRSLRARGAVEQVDVDVLTPRSLDEALRLKAEHPDAVPIQGGTDLMVALNFDRAPAGRCCSNLNEVAELRGWSRRTARSGWVPG